MSFPRKSPVFYIFGKNVRNNCCRRKYWKFSVYFRKIFTAVTTQGIGFNEQRFSSKQGVHLFQYTSYHTNVLIL